MPPPQISVVIPTYNRRDILARTLPAVLSQDFSAEQYEVIVVMDGSRDGTAEMLRGLKAPCELRVLQQPNRGQAAARNAGWKAARGELVLFLDDDLFCDRLLLQQHVAAHAGTDPVVVVAPVYISPDTPRTTTMVYIEGRDAHWRRLVSEKTTPERGDDLCVGRNCSLPRSVLEACGGFDERFAQMREDVELGLRLRERGYRFRVEPDAITTELYDKSADELVKLASLHAQSEFVLCREHPEYRTESALARIDRNPRQDAILRRIAARLPFSPEPPLRLLFRVADRFNSVPRAQQAALFLLQCRISAAFWRAAIREAGSWAILRQRYGKRVLAKENDWSLDEATTMVESRQSKVDFIVDFIGDRGTAGLVLDLGSNDCGIASRLELGTRVIAADRLLYAREARRKYGLSAVALDADAPLPFAAGAFDMVIVSGLLEYLSSPPKMLREVARILKTQGQLVLVVPNRNNLRLRYDRWAGRRDSGFDPPRMRQVLREAGFAVREQRNCPYRSLTITGRLLYGLEKLFPPVAADLGFVCEPSAPARQTMELMKEVAEA
jgi:glycosyltransferase involved in cell wall biosynthesis